MGVYDIYLLAGNGKGRVIAYDEIRILVGTNLPKATTECKDGNWESFNSSFENQGACIKYVNTGY